MQTTTRIKKKPTMQQSSHSDSSKFSLPFMVRECLKYLSLYESLKETPYYLWFPGLDQCLQCTVTY